MTRQQAQLIRLLLMCAAWALGQVLVYDVLTASASSYLVQGVDLVVPAALAIGVYVVTEGLGRPRADQSDARYWRGRRIDDDPPKRDRWN